MRDARIAVLIIALVCFIAHTFGAPADVSISSVTLLLPNNVCSSRLKPAQHTLRATGGCFRWHSSAPHIVRIASIPELPTGDHSVPLSESHPHLCEVDGIYGTTEAVVSVVQDDLLPKSKVTTKPDGQSSSNQAADAVTDSSRGRQSAWVWAEDIATGRRAECEVFVDRVNSLLIGTSTRRINVGDTESLELQAFDEHKNIFSTLEGLPFEWKNSAEHVARRLSFHEANMEVSPTLLALEKEGFSADRLPIQGLIPGRANFTARLVCSGPQIETTIEMLVTEPLGIHPSLTRICPGATARLRLYTRQHKAHLLKDGSQSDGTSNEDDDENGKLTDPLDVVEGHRVLRMPSSQYKWGTSNASIASVDRDLGICTAYTEGHTQITVHDQSLDELSCRADVIVARPTKIHLQLHRALSLTTRPLLASQDAPSIKLREALNNPKGMVSEADFQRHGVYEHPFPRCDGDYHVTQGHRYAVKVFLYDKWDRVIDSCDGISVTIQGTAATLVDVSGSWATISTANDAVGTVTLTASLPTSSTNQEPLSSSVRIHVSPPSITSLDFVNIPQPSLPSSQTQGDSSKFSSSSVSEPCISTVSVTGGSGYFAWISSNRPVLQASGVEDHDSSSSSSSSSTSPTSTLRPTRFGRLLANGPAGDSQVQALDRCNPDNHASMRATVSPVGQLCRVPGPVELPVGETTPVSFLVKDILGRPFYNCSCLRLESSIVEGNSIALASSQDGVPCSHDPTSSALVSPDQPPAGPLGCFTVLVKAMTPGFARLQARVHVGSHRSKALPTINELEAINARKDKATYPGPFPGLVPVASETFAVFKNIDADYHEIVAAVGTAVTVHWMHGPLPWPCFTNGFKHELSGFGLCRRNPVSSTVKTVGPWLAEPVAYQPGRGLISSREGDDMYKHTVDVTALTTTATLAQEGLLSVARLTTPQDPAGHKFKITCLERTPKGPTALSISVGNTPCPSNPLPRSSQATIAVSCYPPVCVAQRKLTLGVGEVMQATLRNTGERHPLLNNLTYYVEDPSVATVDEHGFVTGKSLGITVLHARYSHPALESIKWGEDGLHDVIVVHVAFSGFHVEIGSSLLTFGEETVATVTGNKGERPGHSAFNLVQVQWALEEGPRAGVAIHPVWAYPEAVPSSPRTTERSNLIAMSRAGSHFAVRAGWIKPQTKWLQSLSTPSVRVSGRGQAGAYTLVARVSVAYPPMSASPVNILSDRTGSTCPEHPPLSQLGNVVHYTLRKTVNVVPRLTMTSPHSLLLPPAATALITTTLDASDRFALKYLVLSESRSHINGTSTSPLPITVDDRGFLRVGGQQSTTNSTTPLPPSSSSTTSSSTDVAVKVTATVTPTTIASSISSAIEATPISSSSVGDMAGAQSIETAQSVTINVAVREPRALDILPGTLLPVTGLEDEALALLEFDSGAASASRQRLGFSASRRPRAVITGDSSAASIFDEPLCPQSSASALADQFTKEAVNTRPSTSKSGTSSSSTTVTSTTNARQKRQRPWSNIVHVALKDGRGQFFDSVEMTTRRGTLHVAVDRPDLIEIRVLSSANSFSLDGAVHNNGSDSLSSIAPQGVLATLAITAVASAPDTDSSVTHAQVTLQVRHPSWGHVLPLHLQVNVGSTQYCSNPTWQSTGARLAVPLALDQLRALSASVIHRTATVGDTLSRSIIDHTLLSTKRRKGRPLLDMASTSPSSSSSSVSSFTSASVTATPLSLSSWLGTTDADHPSSRAHAVGNRVPSSVHGGSLPHDAILGPDEVASTTLSTSVATRRSEWLAAFQTFVESAFASAAPTLSVRAYVRSVDATTGLALVDVVPQPTDAIVSAVLNGKQDSTDHHKQQDTPPQVPHIDEWTERVALTIPEAMTTTATVISALEKVERIFDQRRIRALEQLKKKRLRRGGASKASSSSSLSSSNDSSDDSDAAPPLPSMPSSPLVDFDRPLLSTTADFTAAFHSALAQRVMSQIDSRASREAAARALASSSALPSSLTTATISPASASFWPFDAEPIVSWAWHSGHTAVTLRCLSALHTSARSLQTARTEALASIQTQGIKASVANARQLGSITGNSAVSVASSDEQFLESLQKHPCLETAISTSGSDKPLWWGEVLGRGWDAAMVQEREERYELLMYISTLRGKLRDVGQLQELDAQRMRGDQSQNGGWNVPTYAIITTAALAAGLLVLFRQLCSSNSAPLRIQPSGMSRAPVAQDRIVRGPGGGYYSDVYATGDEDVME